jgi:hypothetical protein
VAEDLGVDGLSDTAEYWLVPNKDRTDWDTLKYDSTRLPNPKDPGRDNYDPNDVRHWCGTEGDMRVNNFPESEDLNGSGYLDLTDDYLRSVVDSSVQLRCGYKRHFEGCGVRPSHSYGPAGHVEGLCGAGCQGRICKQSMA